MKAESIKIKVNGSWNPAAISYVKVNGSWKNVTNMWMKISGEWVNCQNQNTIGAK